LTLAARLHMGLNLGYLEDRDESESQSEFPGVLGVMLATAVGKAIGV